jgi:hypothetical protein
MLAWKQLFIQRVRNSSLVERQGIDDNRASSILPKLWIYRFRTASGRGAFHSCDEAAAVRRGGAYGKANVGISNEKAGEKPAHRKTKVS